MFVLLILALGGVPASLLDDNNKKWSGDRCITPEAVPGGINLGKRKSQMLSLIYRP